MRTTIDLETDVLAAAKERAAQRRTTLSRIVEDAVKAYLAEPPASGDTAPFELVLAGQPGGQFPTARRVSELLEEDEGWGRSR